MARAIVNKSKVFRPGRRRVVALHDRLLEVYGPQGWWPGDTAFEIIVGAILTQNTAWINVEKAIANLKQGRALEPDSMAALGSERLAHLIRPAGYFNIKARRLLNLLEALHRVGGVESWGQLHTADLRSELLAVNGVGPETADDILLYAYGRPVFVVDAYTRRLFGRLRWCAGNEPYDELRLGVEKSVGKAPSLLQELHALIVVHAKNHCRTKPECAACTLKRECKFVL